jgi:hypothetical protein
MTHKVDTEALEGLADRVEYRKIFQAVYEKPGIITKELSERVGTGSFMTKAKELECARVISISKGFGSYRYFPQDTPEMKAFADIVKKIETKTL